MCAALNSAEVKRKCGQHVYTMICGWMTPKQKQIVEQRSVIDVEKYTAILNWFVKKSGHPGYEGFVSSNECPQPEFIRKQTVKTTLIILKIQKLKMSS